jgi:hypothetical protein
MDQMRTFRLVGLRCSFCRSRSFRDLGNSRSGKPSCAGRALRSLSRVHSGLSLSALLIQESASNFLASGLRDKSRAGQSSCRSSIIDLIDERLVERNVDPNSSTCIGKQRNSKQDSSCLDRCLDILVSQNNIRGTRRRHLPTCTFQRLCMLTKSGNRIRDSLFQSLTRRETSFDIWKPDTKGAVGVFLHDRYIVRRHCLETSSHIRSQPPAGQLVNPAYESGRQIPPRMRHGDDCFPLGMLERVVIAIHPIKHPSILLQHPDQLAAVSFPYPPPKQSREIDLGCSIRRQAKDRSPTAGSLLTRVYNQQ